MNAPLWILVFQKAFEATLHFVFSIDGANQHFSWLPLFHLLLNLLHIRHLHNIWRFSKQTNLSNILEVMWSAPYNFGGFLRRQAHKLAAPPKCQNLETKFIFVESECVTKLPFFKVSKSKVLELKEVRCILDLNIIKKAKCLERMNTCLV